MQSHDMYDVLDAGTSTQPTGAIPPHQERGTESDFTAAIPVDVRYSAPESGHTADQIGYISSGSDFAAMGPDLVGLGISTAPAGAQLPLIDVSSSVRLSPSHPRSRMNTKLADELQKIYNARGSANKRSKC